MGKPTKKIRTPTKSRRVRSRTVVATFILATIAFNAGATYFLDDIRPDLRDPEYGRRIIQLRARITENPERPLVLVVGSSRTAMGVSPGEWEKVRPNRAGTSDPILFNLSLIGGGPILELITLLRATDDGVAPAAILLEYWPPLFSTEDDGLGPMTLDRISSRDRAFLRDYCLDSGSIASDPHWLNPIFGARHRLLAQLAPRWMPSHDQVNWTWEDIDGWGWKPGCDFKPGPSEAQATLLKQARKDFERRFANYKIGAREDRAFRESVAAARNITANVKILYMPESREFHSWCPDSVKQASREHLTRLSHELELPVIDAREWMEDGLFSDGFHLTRTGAAEFTRKLAPLTVSSHLPLVAHSD